MTQVFSAQAEAASSGPVGHKGGPLVMAVQVVSGSGTCKLQMSPDNGTTWIDVEGVTVTATGTKAVPHLPKCSVRLNLGTVTNPVFNAWIGQ